MWCYFYVAYFVRDFWYCVTHLRQAIERLCAEPAEPAETPQELLDSLMSLRSENASIKGRTGRAVTVFIPDEVLERLRPDTAKQQLFVNKVAGQLVRRSLYAVWNEAAGRLPFSNTYRPLVE